MSEAVEDDAVISVDVTNIGGIDETSADLSPGITALVDPNATNRTSFVQAVAGALGTDFVTLKGDADRGTVTLTVGNETYTRELRREDCHVSTGGNPYLDDPEPAELYAVLVESNEIRRTVRRGGDLRDLLLAPLDTEEISERIADLVARRREVDRELDRLSELEGKRADLEAERQRLEKRHEELEAKLVDRREALQAVETDPEASVAGGSEPAAKRGALREARTDLEAVERDLEIERESLASLRDNRETIEAELASLSAPDNQRLSAVRERIDDLREQKRTLEAAISELQGVLRFNTERLDGADSVLSDALGRSGDRAVTAGLDPAERTITCWTCGSEVHKGRIEEMVDQLRALRQEKSTQQNQLEAEIADLTEDLESLEAAHEQRQHLESRREEVTERIETRESTVERLERRRDELAERVADLESDIEARQESRQDELLELQAEVSQLEVERDRTAERLEEVEAQLRDIGDELAASDDLEREREEISEQLQELRTRVDRIEAAAVEAFNTHMDAIIDQLEYDNLDRIWIEPTQQEVTDGRERVSEEALEVHVVRETAEGMAYEDSLDHLSESERELVGLVVALAGYLVHDVHETVPFMLLDSLEMVDGDRLVDLVAYLEEFVPYLVVVLLPDHADAFETNHAPSHHRIVDV